jgi:hypothetical protein
MFGLPPVAGTHDDNALCEQQRQGWGLLPLVVAWDRRRILGRVALDAPDG